MSLTNELGRMLSDLTKRHNAHDAALRKTAQEIAAYVHAMHMTVTRASQQHLYMQVGDPASKDRLMEQYRDAAERAADQLGVIRTLVRILACQIGDPIVPLDSPKEVDHGE